VVTLTIVNAAAAINEITEHLIKSAKSFDLAIKKKKDNNKIKSFGCSPISVLKISKEKD